MFALQRAFAVTCVVTYSLTWILNLWRVRAITLTEQFIMAYGGLRGAMAFSLATTLPGDDYKDTLVTTTLFIILFTTVLQVLYVS